MTPRGRPRLQKGPAVDSTSRSTSRRGTSLRNPPQKPSLASAKKTKTSKSTTLVIMDSEDDGDDSIDELSPMKSASKKSNLPSGKSAPQAEAPQSRTSLSSVSNGRDSAEASGYSTPGTSMAATPATGSKATEISVVVPTSSRGTLDMAALAALDAELAANNAAVNARLKQMKRKRPVSDDEEEKVDKLEDASFQLAMALQREEYAEGNAMQLDSGSSPRFRNSSRPLRPVQPKAYGLDSGDDSDENKPMAQSRSRFFKKQKFQISDSEAEDSDIYSNSSDDDDGDVLMTSSKTKLTPSTTINRSGGFGQKSATKAPTRPKSRTTYLQRNTDLQRNQKLIGNGSSARGPGRPPKAASAVAATRKSFHRADSSSSALTDLSDSDDKSSSDEDVPMAASAGRRRRVRGEPRQTRQAMKEARAVKERKKLELHHPEIKTMWDQLEVLAKIPTAKIEQPANINRELKPFQLEGVNWMQEMEKTQWGGGLLGDEMGMGKTIQAVSLIMSDYPAKHPSLVLVPPVALMQWQQEMGDYTDGTLKTFVYHGTNTQLKTTALKDLKGFDVILMSYNSLESMFRAQEKGRTKEGKNYKVKSVIHQLHFHRVILDEAHCIKSRSSGTAKACFALQADHKWCLSGTPLQNRIGEFFSLVRFLDIRPFACYLCKQCPCSKLEWGMNEHNKCSGCGHSGMQHVSVFNQEILNPIQKHGNEGLGKKAFEKLRLLTERFMLRRVKRDHSSSMELPAKEIFVDRHFFGEVENDFAGSIMNSTKRKFETYVNNNVLLNNYANIFGLIMQMRQVADHPDLILKRDVEGGQNVLICRVCDEPAEDPVRSQCKHDFCRSCIKPCIQTAEKEGVEPECPRCHVPLSIDMEQAAMVQDEAGVKKTSIINRIKMEDWTSSSKIEALVYDLHELRSRNSSCKSIIFSQFTSMLQLVEWRLHRAGITTVMLDGSMTPAQRQASITHFMTNVDVECFLVSLKAGGVALNLTEASKVFIIDPWWNPAAEWQSADRCHRIGQTRPCSITRLCIEDSVESRMVLLQEKKANMINSTINNDSAAMESLTPEDMQFLFRGS